MKLKEFLKKQLAKNDQKNFGDVVISSRVRIARNVKGKPFPWRASPQTLDSIWNSASGFLQKQEHFTSGITFFLPELDPIDRQLLVERHLISHNHMSSEIPRGVVFDGGERLSVMINEEDHLRIACILPGFDLKTAAVSVDTLDNRLAGEFGFAYSDKYGFLTTCPTNAGTGMRVSVLVHIPGLVITDEIEPILAELSKVGVTIRGFYGEGTKVIGDIFQISNACTLGRDENDVVRNIEYIVASIISYENEARKKLMSGPQKISTEDKIYRSAALLSGARKIDFREAMALISRVLLGINLGLEIRWKKEQLAELMTITQPAHLQELMGGELNAEERDLVRARIIRQRLN
ncbi:MAG: ATP--guanido phosphotransferase [Elusimicrobiota bacterium]